MELSSLIAQNTQDSNTKLVNLGLAKELQSGATLGGARYTYVQGNKSTLLNFNDLLAAYELAKMMPRYLGVIGQGTPTQNYYINQTFYDDDLTVYRKVKTNQVNVDLITMQLPENSEEITEAAAKANHATVVVGPGIYESTNVVIQFDASNINVISLTGQPDIIIRTSGNIVLSGHNSTYIGINTETRSLFNGNTSSNLSTTFIKCVGGNSSYRTVSTQSYNRGTFIDCVGGALSFGGGNEACEGKYIRCQAGANSFGQVGTHTGEFIDCIGGDESFMGSCQGTYIRCKGLLKAFSPEAHGYFEECEGDQYAFGGDGAAAGSISGTLIRCKGGLESFGGAYGSINIGAYLLDCIGDQYSFGGGGGDIMGTLERCIGGQYSFGFDGQINDTARLYNCRLKVGTFPVPTHGGLLVNCIDGTNAIITT